MIQYIIELIFGIIAGIFLGITGMPATGFILLGLDYLKINNYKSILGSVLFLNLFPISIGSVLEFYKTGNIDFTMGWILLFSIITGSYLSSKFVVGSKKKLSNKNIKYITAYFTFVMAILFLISAYYEKD